MAKEKPQKTKKATADASYWPVYLFAREIIHSFDWGIVCGNVAERRPYCPLKCRKKSSNLPRRVHHWILKAYFSVWRTLKLENDSLLPMLYHFFRWKKIKEYAIFLIYRRIRNKFIFFLIFILINFNFEYLSLFYFLPVTSKVGFKVKKKNIAYDTHVHLICNFLPFEIL